MKSLSIYSVFSCYGLGLALTLGLNHGLHLSPILSSVLPTLLFCVLTERFEAAWGPPFYAGTFAGMVSAAYVTGLWPVLLLGAVGPILFQSTRALFPTTGGRLGAISFVNCLLCYALLQWGPL